MKVVLDTNCLLPAIFKRSAYHWLWDAFRSGAFTLCYTTEILTEYEEKLSQHYSPLVAETVVDELLNAHNVERVTPFYNWRLITNDPDDNKFVDCAIAAGASIITNDRHFNVLRSVPFPSVQLFGIEDFKQTLQFS